MKSGELKCINLKNNILWIILPEIQKKVNEFKEKNE